MNFEEIKREGAADAVLRIVAAKTLLNPHVGASDVAAVAGLTRSDLEAALKRLRASRQKRPPRPHTTPLDDLVLEAVDAHGGTLRPRQLKIWLLEHDHEYSTAGLADSLARLVALDRLAHPSHGTYCLPGQERTHVVERGGRTRLVLSSEAEHRIAAIELRRSSASSERMAELA